MKPKDIFLLALNSIRHRKLRSWLTILGIVIAMASIVTLIGISMGVSKQIGSRMNTLGSNIITVSSGGQFAQRSGGGFGMAGPPGGFGGGPGGTVVRRSSEGSNITFREADDLRTLAGVYKLDARVSDRATVKYRDQNSSLSVIGTEPDAFPDSVGIDILYGRYLSTSDQHSVVLGYSVANATFRDLDMLNKQVKINDIPFRVVGILKRSGSSAFGTVDNAVFIPQETARDLFDQDAAVSEIVIIVGSGYNTTEVASRVEKELMTLHRVTEQTEDFRITTAASLESAVSSVSDTLTMLLAGIASISLLVGGIGVANTMFMSVLEQTKDIGVLKSLGAKNRDIVYMFLGEAAIIGFVGGFLGVALSFVASSVLELANVPTSITAEVVLGGLLFSVVVGLAAGISPARNAASIPPVEALRYE